jgi:hypothetical protein
VSGFVQPAPSPAELWNRQVKEASAKPAEARPEQERPEYAQGFENGAAMVRKALDMGRQPFVLLPEDNAPAMTPRLLSTVPEGLSIEAEPLEIEMDAATGLRIWNWGSAEGSAYARGQRDGFAWALSHHGQSLVKPCHRPELPSRWLCWPHPATSVKLETATREVEIWWRADALLWRSAGQGFPGQRRWRPADPGWKPRFVALQEDVVWLDTVGHGAVALDLETGLIRELRLSPNPQGREAEVEAGAAAERAQLAALMKELDPSAARQRWREEARSPKAVARRQQLRTAAEGGDPEAMFALASNLAALEEPDSLESAAWLQKAAEKGCVEAMGTLGAWHFEGRHVAKSQTLARQWLEKAAKAGDSDARHMLASLFTP